MKPGVIITTSKVIRDVRMMSLYLPHVFFIAKIRDYCLDRFGEIPTLDEIITFQRKWVDTIQSQEDYEDL